MISVREPAVYDTYIITLDNLDSTMRFGGEMSDSRLTELSDETVFQITRGYPFFSKRPGRPLAKGEM